MYNDAEYQRKRRQERIAAGLCARCGKRPPDEGVQLCGECREYTRKRFQYEHATPELRAKRVEQHKRWRKKNREAYNASARKTQRKYRERIRAEAIAHYGGKCVCCGESTPIFLTLDHVNNDGAEHRKQVGRSTRIVEWARRNNFPDTLQVLCWNCNMAKHYLGECPHNAGSD